MKPPSELISDHDVMTCPACGETIRAKIHVSLQVGDPALSGTGKSVNVKVDSQLTRFHVNHACHGVIEDGFGPFNPHAVPAEVSA